MNDINKYQKWTRSTIKYESAAEVEYLSAGLVGEVGELYSAMAKYWRDDYDYQKMLNKIELELGDILWMLVRLADYYEFDMSTILQSNINKIEGRLVRETIKGYDDEHENRKTFK